MQEEGLLAVHLADISAQQDSGQAALRLPVDEGQSAECVGGPGPAPDELDQGRLQGRQVGRDGQMPLPVQEGLHLGLDPQQLCPRQRSGQLPQSRLL